MLGLRVLLCIWRVLVLSSHRLVLEQPQDLGKLGFLFCSKAQQVKSMDGLRDALKDGLGYVLLLFVAVSNHLRLFTLVCYRRVWLMLPVGTGTIYLRFKAFFDFFLIFSKNSSSSSLLCKMNDILYCTVHNKSSSVCGALFVFSRRGWTAVLLQRKRRIHFVLTVVVVIL